MEKVSIGIWIIIAFACVPLTLIVFYIGKFIVTLVRNIIKNK